MRVYAQELIFPGLAMSRSIGDLMAKKLGVIEDPEIFVYDVKKQKVKPIALVLGTDGIWDVLKNEEIAKYMNKYILFKDSAKVCAENLTKDASLRWLDQPFNSGDFKKDIDDITIIVAYLV